MGGRKTVSGFASFMVSVEPTLRRALVASYGAEVGREATLDALTWAWRNWSRVQGMENPRGFLFRVGQSAARRALFKQRLVMPTRDPVEQAWTKELWFEPGLGPALARLTRNQRAAVVLCHGFEWTHREVGDLLGLSTSSVQNHVERGLSKLQAELT